MFPLKIFSYGKLVKCIERVQLKNHLVKTFQVIILLIFSPFLLTLPIIVNGIQRVLFYTVNGTRTIYVYVMEQVIKSVSQIKRANIPSQYNLYNMKLSLLIRKLPSEAQQEL